MIEKVHEDIDIDFKKQGLMAITSSFYPIYGNEVLESLKSKVSEYSDDYQRKVLINTKFPNLDVLKLHAFRKDFVPYYKHLSKGLTSILSCISAVNKSYFPGEKRVGWLIESFEIKPTDLHIKMEKILRGNYSDSIKNLEELINEVINLIIENVEIDIDDLDQDWKSSRRGKNSAESLSNILK